MTELCQLLVIQHRTLNFIKDACFSTEIRVSPTKPCGKGSKRKQDELDEDDYEEEEERQTWVEALTQELADDDAPEEDPDYEVGALCSSA